MENISKQPPRTPSPVFQPPTFNGKGFSPEQFIKYPLSRLIRIDMQGVMNLQKYREGIGDQIIRSICCDRPWDISLKLPVIFEKEKI
jgi:hypothetical protein